MISEYLAKTHQAIAQKPILNVDYKSRLPKTFYLTSLSSIAQQVYYERHPAVRKVRVTEDAEITALRLLDYLSSKQGFIRRKGPTFRTTRFYHKTVPLFAKAIAQQKPIRLSTLCFCTTLANTKFGGDSPFPHMASYIALENIHRIVQGAREIYQPGIDFFLGFEGRLFQPLYFHGDPILNSALAILQELNKEAARNIFGDEKHSSVQIVDAIWMIEQAFGSYKAFEQQVEEQKALIPDEDLVEWKQWYRDTVSLYYFSSKQNADQFIEDRARWRQAVYKLKNNGGKFGKGLVGFDEDIIPFTPSGRRQDILAIQLVPENSYLPHQRIITHEPKANRWRMMAYEDLRKTTVVYAPRYVKDYFYPFYFEMVDV